MFELSIAVNFEAAHCIQGYPGKCSRLHGHNWKVEVTVIGSELNKLGMLIDFHDLKQEVNRVISALDHVYLNDIDAFKSMNPTAENIAKYIYDELANCPAFKNSNAIPASVTVWESNHSSVKYFRGER